MNNYGLRDNAKEFPMMLVLSFAYPCNALCPHCPYTNSSIRKEYKDMPYMDEKIFKRLADESGPYKSYLRISGGGEPMLHPKAVELLTYAKKKGCKLGLITNGSKFEGDSLEKLIDADIDLIEFSVDADNEKDYAIYRKGLDWNLLNKNVERAVEYRNKTKSKTKIIVSAVNQKGVDIDSIEDYWVNKSSNKQNFGQGADYIIKRKYLSWGNNTEIDQTKSADPAVYTDTENTPCPFIFERLNIDSRGNVMVCGYDISANTSMGNVMDKGGIKEIWNGEGFNYYRTKHLNNEGKEISMCSQCPDWKYRSWNHNYWKVIKESDKVWLKKIKNMDTDDDFQVEKL
jgi:radical SAM protein with 4Fe4S-binding SPASM domain|tara:strand:+ start:451 stop:1479 length:1029 start_codon:yes stop_codon:yes gene_type:complete